MLIALKTQAKIKKLKAQLKQEFEIKYVGEAKKILGMEIIRDEERGKLCVTHTQYINKLLHVSVCLGSQNQ